MISHIAKILSKNFLWKYNLKRRVMAVEINSIHGIGAKLVWVLEILAYCEINNLIPQFKFTYPDSSSKHDYFEKFFAINNSYNHPHSIEFVKIGSLGELGLDKNYNDELNIELAVHLIKKYLIIKDDVLSEVEVFCAKRFNKKNVLGVHYRGTDKVSEAPYVSYDMVEKNIKFYLDKFPNTDAIFTSSDDNNFISYIKNSSIECPIIYRDDSYRSNNNIPIHYTNQNKYDINRDAIINCLILSRCNALMKTASILSAWSILFNPNLPLIMLNEPVDECKWFPEKMLIDNVLYDSIT